MVVISSIVVLCDCILLQSLILSSIAASIPANIPDSDLPFEFNHNKGSEVIGENLLTQSVSSDGKTVFSTNSPQPIKKYNSNKNSKEQSTKPTYDEKMKINKPNSNKIPQNGRMKINRNNSNNYSTHTSSPDMIQWNVLDNIGRILPVLPGMIGNMRVIYI